MAEKKYAVCVQEYTAKDGSTAISLALNEQVEILRQDDQGLWWFVRSSTTQGYFPAQCLQEVVQEAPAPAPVPVPAPAPVPVPAPAPAPVVAHQQVDEIPKPWVEFRFSLLFIFLKK